MATVAVFDGREVVVRHVGLPGCPSLCVVLKVQAGALSQGDLHNTGRRRVVDVAVPVNQSAVTVWGSALEAAPVAADAPTPDAAVGVVSGAGSPATAAGVLSDDSRRACGLGFEVAGVVAAVGDGVEGLAEGDNVVAILSLASGGGAAATHVIVPAVDCVQRPPLLAPVAAVSCLLPGLRAYTALHYKLRRVADEVLVVTDAGDGFGLITTQLCAWLGAKVIGVTADDKQADALREMPETVVAVVDPTREDAVQRVLNATGGLGALAVIDGGGPASKHLPAASCVQCLAVGGSWLSATPQPLDPTLSRLLFLKGATLGFLFEPSWMLAPTHHGRLLTVLQEVLELSRKSTLRPSPPQEFPVEDARAALEALHNKTSPGRVVIVPTAHP